MATDIAGLLLALLVYPAWVAAGLADWACHRRTRIQDNSGLAENIFHWALLAEMGVVVLAALLLETNAAVLLLGLGAFLVHELTTYVELRYTVPRRFVGPFEQMVHSFMELLPLVGLALLAVIAWEDVLAVVGGEADFGLRLKAEPLPPDYLLAALAAAALFNLLPMAEETWRCLRTRRAKLAS
jgi:hypothetical protein